METIQEPVKETIKDTAKETAKEFEYQRLLSLMKSYEYITDLKKRVKFYKRLSKQFGELANYEDSDKYAEQCLKLAKSAKKELKKTLYKEALLKKSEAVKAEDYIEAAEIFRKIPGYKDADDLALECDNIAGTMHNKAAKKHWIKKILIALAVVAIIIIPQTSYARYYMAKAFMHFGSYTKAIDVYEKLGTFKDSKARLIESRYLNANILAKDKKYKTAAGEYAKLGSYRDSESKLVLMQQKLIEKSKPGTKLKIGKYEWVILYKDDSKAFLMKYSSMNEMPYNSEAVDTTWESSSLREWLNSDFLNNSFSEAEKANIILSEVDNSDNPIYNTSGGNDTMDYIFILSAGEAREYSDLFPDFKTNTWLRSPGAYANTAAFLSENGDVMEHGYIVNSDSFKIRPVMWYKLD